MMFERLKVSVVVALVIFIFIVGNVLAVGLLQKATNYQKDKPQDNSPNYNVIIPDIRKNNKEITPSTTITTNEQNKEEDKSSQTSKTTKETTQTTITQKKSHRRTRAS